MVRSVFRKLGALTIVLAVLSLHTSSKTYADSLHSETTEESFVYSSGIGNIDDDVDHHGSEIPIYAHYALEELQAQSNAVSWIELARARSPQPPSLLPFGFGETWRYTGGPHSSGVDVQGQAIGPSSSIDLATPTPYACEWRDPSITSDEWVTASTPGIVFASGKGQVIVDLDGDGDINNSWAYLYYHMSDTDRIASGTMVKTGDRLGRVDCMWGKTNGTHVHFARLYKGEYIQVEDSLAPMVLSGWRFHGNGNVEYWGTASHPVHDELTSMVQLGDYGIPVNTAKYHITADIQPDQLQAYYSSDLSNVRIDPEEFAQVLARSRERAAIPITKPVTIDLEALAAASQKVAKTIIPEFADKRLVFKIPVRTFHPDPIMENPESVDGFIRGRLKGKGGVLLPVASKTLSSDEKDHSGRDAEIAWDISAQLEAPIYPAAAGVVQYAGCDNRGNYGCSVSILHDDGFVTLYAHLINERDPNFVIDRYDPGDPQGYVLAKTGQRVTQWTPLGRVGWTGYTSFGPHVHFVIIDNLGVKRNVSDFFDRSLLTYKPFSPPLEWEWDRPYDPAVDAPLSEAPPQVSPEPVFYPTTRYLLLGEWITLWSAALVIVLALIFFKRFGWILRLVWRILPTRWLGRFRPWSEQSVIMPLLAKGFAVGMILGFLTVSQPVQVFAKAATILSWKSGREILVNLPDSRIRDVIPKRMPSLRRVTSQPQFQNAQDATTASRSPIMGTISWLAQSVAVWWPEIETAANNHDIEPDFLAIIVTVESCGDPNAGSGAGAQGLTQVMPGTASDIARQRGIPFSAEQIWNPETNLDFGAYYLSQQLKAFGTVEMAAIAYNGGPGTAMKYQQGAGLPLETQRYREWVTGMWSERSAASSPTFERWLAAGGSVLCQNAERDLGISRSMP